MKKLLLLLGLLALAGTAAQADERDTVKRSAEILREFRSMPERQVPRSVLRDARGLAIMRVVKVGFVFSGKGGEGVVIARTGNGWSGPSFIGTGGAGWGLQMGAQVTDFVFVLNNRDAVRAFSRGGNVTLGGDISAAAGPVGRDVQANVAPKAAVYTYSLSKGLFAGVSLEGAVIVTEKGKNERLLSTFGHCQPNSYRQSVRPGRERRFAEGRRPLGVFFFTNRCGFRRLKRCGPACSSWLFLLWRRQAMPRSRSANWLTGS